MWNSEDKYGFDVETLNKRGQINLEQEFGQIIFQLASNIENQVLVDIGTWNGLGSTRCFIEGMKNNKSSKLFTIENNSEKMEAAKKIWSELIETENLDVNFLNGSLIDNNSIELWIKNYKIDLNEQEKYWLSIDKINSVNILQLECDKIDVLLIDGGEFTGYLEMKLLKDKSKYILLDDVNSIKNKLSREYLLQDSQFTLVKEDLLSRNGYSFFKKIMQNEIF
jgi:hypothetical protein